jgi:hypothetical protein
MKLVNDILLKSHKASKDMYQSKILMFPLDLKYEKIDVCPGNCMLFWKELANDKKCLECDQSWFVKVVSWDGEKVMIEVAYISSFITFLSHLT